MQSKINWKIFFISSLAIITLGGSYYLRFYDNDTISNDQQRDKILQKPEPLLASRIIYFWNSNNNNFEKVTKDTMYDKTAKNKIVSSKEDQADLNNNLIQETYTLENSRLTIAEKENIAWQSPADWRVDNFFLADSNNDGILDINLSVWKAGDFGESKPFWVEENDMGVKNHFFVFDFVNGAVSPIWQSSNLEKPNCEFIFADIDGDEKNDLIAIEGDYSQKLNCDGNYVAVWKWNGWGFSNEWRSEKGSFANLEIEKNDGKNYVAVDSF